jgi:hypothetical protein
MVAEASAYFVIFERFLELSGRLREKLADYLVLPRFLPTIAKTSSAGIVFTSPRR